MVALIFAFLTSDASVEEFAWFLRTVVWIAVAPLVIALIRWLYNKLYGDRGPTWLERQTGVNLDEGEGAEPMLVALPDFRPIPEGHVPEVNLSILAATLPELPAFLPARVLQLFKAYNAPWCIAGGWAIDLFLGGVSRDHHDVEVAVLLRDQQQLFTHILGWQPRYCVPDSTERRRWQPGEWLHGPVHELHTKPPQSDVDELEILLDRSAGDDWIYRRDGRVRRPLSQAIRFNPDGIPYLAPEIVLLYKSKNPRERDEADFALAAPRLDAGARAWLRSALTLTAPDHPWLKRLRM